MSMAKLTTGARNALPNSAFAGPHRSFPVHDKPHARAALRLLNRAKGLSAAQKKRITGRARSKLGLRKAMM
jgi:hypothetical protein